MKAWTVADNIRKEFTWEERLESIWTDQMTSGRGPMYFCDKKRLFNKKWWKSSLHSKLWKVKVCSQSGQKMGLYGGVECACFFAWEGKGVSFLLGAKIKEVCTGEKTNIAHPLSRIIGSVPQAALGSKIAAAHVVAFARCRLFRDSEWLRCPSGATEDALINAYWSGAYRYRHQ